MGATGRRVFAASLLLGLVAGPGIAPALAQHRAGGPEDVMPAGIVPRYLLMDANGRAVTNEDFAGRFQLISFGFISCPDVCPTTLAQMALILKNLGDEGRRLQPIFITVDPERDTAPVLREYTAAFDGRILGLTGASELIRSVAGNFKVHYEKVREPGAPPESYTMDHTAGMYLLGPDGRFLVKFAHAASPEEVTQRVRGYMAEFSGPARVRR